MQSKFYHQHASDYIQAWNELTNICYNMPMGEQIKFLTEAKERIQSKPLVRKTSGSTDAELAFIAACDELLFARTVGENGVRPDPTTRNLRAIIIGENDECQRCGSPLDDEGFCTDETCPFSDHDQSCLAGFMGHPDHPQANIEKCSCRTIEA
jgi:hypothetical protein